GLAVMGDFGVPARITVSAAKGAPGVISVDKGAGMTGTSFNKALGIVEGFLKHTFAKAKSFSASVSIAFEQNYGGIDGDSATSTQIYAVLSALSGVPIDQGIAVTGSADQFGNVQAIGGANEKITGYFALAKSRGLTGRQGVIIPSANVADLMLSREIVEAVRAGKFHIWGVDHVSQGIEILTGTAYSEILTKAQGRLDTLR
ncbi:MAG: S16 family serine protease, partial [Elusimicrobiota bacterium]